MPPQLSQIDEATASPTVLIVGAGPAGLFAACELLRHDVRPRVVERRSAPHHEARGTALQPAVLEIIDRGGIIEPFLHSGVRIRQVQLLGPGLQEITTTKFAGIGCKYEFQCSLPQWRTETILREHLQSLGVKIEYGSEVKSVEDSPTGLRVTLETVGGTESFTTAYLLGAGGAHSITRHSMHEHLDGETYDGRFIVADAKARLSCPPECGRVIVGPTGFGLFSPLPDNRWLIFVNRNETDTRPELPIADALGALLNARVGVDISLHDVRWVSYFKMHKRAAERLTDGRRFLLGDAAHLSSPLGGEVAVGVIVALSQLRARFGERLAESTAVGGRLISSDLYNPDFAKFVDSFGMDHWKADSPQTLAPGRRCLTAMRPNAGLPTTMYSKFRTRFMAL